MEVRDEGAGVVNLPPRGPLRRWRKVRDAAAGDYGVSVLVPEGGGGTASSGAKATGIFKTQRHRGPRSQARLALRPLWLKAELASGRPRLPPKRIVFALQLS